MVIRRHHSLRDAFAWIGRAAGYVSSTEVLEPSWTRARTNSRGEWIMEQARLDCRFLGPPDDPPVYGDVVVTHPEGSAWLHAAADVDGAAAAGAADGKRRRYPAWALPGGRLVPFSAETFGRWGKEAMEWLRAAAEAVADRVREEQAAEAAAEAAEAAEATTTERVAQAHEARLVSTASSSSLSCKTKAWRRSTSCASGCKR